MYVRLFCVSMSYHNLIHYYCVQYYGCKTCAPPLWAGGGCDQKIQRLGIGPVIISQWDWQVLIVLGHFCWALIEDYHSICVMEGLGDEFLVILRNLRKLEIWGAKCHSFYHLQWDGGPSETAPLGHMPSGLAPLVPVPFYHGFYKKAQHITIFYVSNSSKIQIQHLFAPFGYI